MNSYKLRFWITFYWVDVAAKLSLSIYDLVLLDVCHFGHHHPLTLFCQIIVILLYYHVHRDPCAYVLDPCIRKFSKGCNSGWLWKTFSIGRGKDSVAGYTGCPTSILPFSKAYSSKTKAGRSKISTVLGVSWGAISYEKNIFSDIIGFNQRTEW